VTAATKAKHFAHLALAERLEQQQKLEDTQSEAASFQRRAEATELALATMQVR